MTTIAADADLILAAGPAHAPSVNRALLWAARLIVVIGAVFFALYPGARAITAAITAEGLISLGLIWLLLPIRYEVRHDAVSIVFRFGRSWRIRYADVDEVVPPRQTAGQRVLLTRKGTGLFGRRAVSFSPAEGRRFAAIAGSAVAAWRTNGQSYREADGVERADDFDASVITR